MLNRLDGSEHGKGRGKKHPLGKRGDSWCGQRTLLEIGATAGADKEPSWKEGRLIYGGEGWNWYRMMEITSTIRVSCRAEWRSWLVANHATETQVWIVSDESLGPPGITYLDSVEEAICFGWIDGIAKRMSATEKAQRFTPRRARSNWTELNKERARRLIRLGLMTDAGARTLPDLSAKFEIAADILAAIKVEAEAWQFFQELPDLYIRVRVGYIEEVRKQPAEFNRRLQNFVAKTAVRKMFGNWNDDGRLL